jgi:predicted nucleotidyltransferase
MSDLPQPVAELVDVLAAMPGTVAVVLGGSRALGFADAASDWDLGVYYRGAIDLTAACRPCSRRSRSDLRASSSGSISSQIGSECRGAR